ncbi:alpha/beta fold hydrolase [Actinomadura gamaensis]|uniref:Alpha/beta fold hydrolase n=1 Tax=Actinomadura gamaensis TaxID=1763541 RepID=A0ABV9U828_9ACTN
MPEITARGVRFHVQTLDPAGSASRADAPAVVFVHGLALDNLSSFYYRLAGPVAAAGSRAVLYDQRGHGLSERTPAGYGTSEAVADLFAVLDALDVTRPVHLVANSFGGVVALNAALARPERVAGLALIECYGPAESGFAWTEALLNTLNKSALALEYEDLAARFGALGWRRRARQCAVAERLINGTTLLADVSAAEPVRPADLAALRRPVLAVYGEHSDLRDAGRLLRAHVPDCELHVLPGHAHTVLSDGTDDLLAVLLPWLSRHAQALEAASREAATDPGPRTGARELTCAGGAR